MKPLFIDFHEDSDTRWAHLRLRQEGMPGFVLNLTWLSEFLEALESANKNEYLYFYNNFCVHHDKTSCKLLISTNTTPLLHLSRDQLKKLVAHLKVQYKNFL